MVRRAARYRGGFWRALVLASVALGVPLPALAQRTAAPAAIPAEPPLTEDQHKAQQHFQRAKDLYQQGAYREAAQELETARALDPKAKDLVFNLGIVHEKLAHYDEAIAAFQKYIEMEGVTAAEKQRAESAIKRIEGAKKELPPVPTATTAPTATTTAPVDEDTKPPPKGRIDGLTIGAAAVGVVGLGVGVGFGIAALSSQPSADFTTGRDGTFPDLQDKQQSAHNAAIVADIGFAVGIVGIGAAAYLYFSRPKEAPKKAPPSQGAKATTVSIAPGPTAVVIHGTFP